MVSPFLVASLVSIIPAMLVLLWMMNRYEGYFQHAQLFFALLIGLFLGLVASFFEVVLFGFQFLAGGEFTPVQSFLWTAFGYALFESGLKVMVLGMRRFRARKDTPYYGMPLGVAMGAMMSVQAIAVAYQTAQSNGNPYQFWPFVAMALVPLSAVMVHGATGVWIAKGSADGTLGKGWATGLLLQTPAGAMMWMFWQSYGIGNQVEIGPAAIALAYGFILIWITRKKVLDNVVPPEIQAQVRRDQRRAKRAGLSMAAFYEDSEE